MYYVPPQEKKKKRDIPTICIRIFTAFALIFSLLSFVTPYWLVVRPEKTSIGFRSMGLWVACFDNFVQPEDYISKAYSGCWYIYYKEFDYIRNWINPWWFYLVQMLSIVDLSCNMLAFLVMALQSLKFLSKKRKYDITLIVSMLTATVCFLVVLCIMGVQSLDRQWMPREDYNVVGWSYALAVMAAFFSCFATMMLVIKYLRENCEHLSDRYYAYQTGTSASNGQLDPRLKRTEGSVSGFGGFVDYHDSAQMIPGPQNYSTLASGTSAAAAGAKHREVLATSNTGNWKIPTYSSSGNFYDTFDNHGSAV